MKLVEIIKKLFKKGKKVGMEWSNKDDDRSGETSKVNSLPPKGKKEV